MKRLFCVKKGHKVIPFAGGFINDHEEDWGLIFKDAKHTEAKKLAKEYRDYLGGQAQGYYVSKGPDHIGNHGHKIRRMRLQPKLEAS